jgi:hypothetical protein
MAPAGGNKPAATTSTASGTVTARSRRPNEVALPFVSLPITWVRVGSVAALAGVLGLAAFGLARTRRRRQAGEVGAIDARYGRILLPATSVPLSTSTTVRVDSMKALVRLAAQHDQVILHSHEGSRHDYTVIAEDAAYSYSARSVVRTPTEAPADSDDAVEGILVEVS